MLLSSLAATYVLVHLLSADRLSLIFKASLKLIALTLTSMRGKKRQLYDFFVEIGFFFKFTKLLISNLKKSIWQGLDNADESAPTCFLYWLTIYMIKRNTYFIVLSIYLLINFVC